MDIKQTSTHLQRLGQPFDVIIRKGGVERVLYSNLEPTDVETLLHEVKEVHSPDAIIIQERKRNGNSTIKTEKYPIPLNGLEMNIETPQPLNVPADFKDYMIQDLKEKLSKAESRLEKLENENEQLKKDNFELEKENKYKDKEFDLDKKAQEYEKSNGLSGVLETVSTNPALATIAATAIGRLMGIEVPAMGAIEPSSVPAETANTTQAKVAEQIKNWLAGQSEEVAQKVYALFSQMATDTDKIDECMNYLNELA